MKRLTAAALLCVFLGAVNGCSVVSNKRKSDDKKSKHEVEFLGITVWKTEKSVGD